MKHKSSQVKMPHQSLPRLRSATLLMVLLCALGWGVTLSGGCSAPAESRCSQDVCEVTINRACSASEDCCCSQTCSQGICKTGGNGETTKTEGTVDQSDASADTVTQDVPKPDENKPDNTSQDQPVVPDTTPDTTPDSTPDVITKDVPTGPCSGTETRSCYTGPAGTSGVGECKDGTQTCQSDQWGPCVGSVTPETEICDGKDNNCNGQTDETTPNVGQACQVGKGECSANGNFVCSADGSSTECNAKEGSPSPESCDQKDNDCDGDVDEGCLCNTGDTRKCYSGNTGCRAEKNSYICKAPCQAGTQTCQGKSWGPCVGEKLPEQEVCDRKDNDCDGLVDNGFSDLGKTCSAGIGPCKKAGIFVCKGDAKGVECNAQPSTPQAEKCNNIDDNCNGQTDESFPNLGQNCSKGTNNCKTSGKFVCAPDGTTTVCNAPTPPNSTPERCDGKDNNCNGQVDEIFPNKGQACFAGLGSCRQSGKYICKADGSGTVCNAVPKAAAIEECNNIDDDCDGQVDENIVRSCYSANQRSINVGVCRSGLQRCILGQWSGCFNQRIPGGEGCSSQALDGDCDGEVDEGCSCSGSSSRACGTNLGECSKGLQKCVRINNTTRRWGGCSGEKHPVQELCDGKDNNCNGTADENWPAKGNPCTVGRGECTNKGSLICSRDGKGLVCNVQPLTKSAEVCDGKDNDCDGVIDNGCP